MGVIKTNEKSVIIVGLGANLPRADGIPPAFSLCEAVNEMSSNGINVIAASHIWKSAPVPISDQPWYHNAVCRVDTVLSPDKLLRILLMIEEEAGRVRHTRNEARVLDLDILAYNQEILDQPYLQIPHPRMHKRAFVLYPLQEIVPNWVHPSLGYSLEEMLNSLDSNQKIERTDAKLIK